MRDLATSGAKAGTALDLRELSQRPRWQWHDELCSYTVADMKAALTKHAAGSGTKTAFNRPKASLIEICKVCTKPCQDARPMAPVCNAYVEASGRKKEALCCVLYPVACVW